MIKNALGAAALVTLALSIPIAAANMLRVPGVQQSGGSVEATSLFGKPLTSPPPTGEQKVRLEGDLAQAQAAYDKNPKDAEAIIWLGRRLAYLGRFRDAIDVYSKGIALHPNNAKLYRHRGHRYITVREFDRAISDLSKAASLVRGQADEIEPDGAPNKFNKPRSTLQSNIWYHLGLAQYLAGDFRTALQSYLECMKVSKVNDDMLVATSDWLYMTYRRLGLTAEARIVLEAIKPEMDILENTAYHRRLLMYKGLLQPEQVLASDTTDDVQIATQGYGVGNWYLVSGDKVKAKEIFDKVVAGRSWQAFGYIAAEADLKRGL
jgi:tetratricopeptide (TPR) repeat protein